MQNLDELQTCPVAPNTQSMATNGDYSVTSSVDNGTIFPHLVHGQSAGVHVGDECNLSPAHSYECMVSPVEEMQQYTLASDHNMRSVIVFDWDDTLMCTHYIHVVKGLHLKSPDSCISGELEVQLTQLSHSVIQLLTLACQYGPVTILTNSDAGWVQLSARKFMPLLLPVLEKVTILSARGKYERQFPDAPLKWKFHAFKERINARVTRSTAVVTTLLPAVFPTMMPSQLVVLNNSSPFGRASSGPVSSAPASHQHLSSSSTSSQNAVPLSSSRASSELLHTPDVAPQSCNNISAKASPSLAASACRQQRLRRRLFLSSLIRQGESSMMNNVLSFGDSHVEREAVREAVRECASGMRATFAKSIKFEEQASADALRRQINLVIKCFCSIHNEQKHLDLQLSTCKAPL